MVGAVPVSVPSRLLATPSTLLKKLKLEKKRSCGRGLSLSEILNSWLALGTTKEAVTGMKVGGVPGIAGVPGMPGINTLPCRSRTGGMGAVPGEPGVPGITVNWPGT